jgi:hypothetical protein
MLSYTTVLSFLIYAGTGRKDKPAVGSCLILNQEALTAKFAKKNREAREEKIEIRTLPGGGSIWFWKSLAE